MARQRFVGAGAPEAGRRVAALPVSLRQAASKAPWKGHGLTIAYVHVRL